MGGVPVREGSGGEQIALGGGEEGGIAVEMVGGAEENGVGANAAGNPEQAFTFQVAARQGGGGADAGLRQHSFDDCPVMRICRGLGTQAGPGGGLDQETRVVGAKVAERVGGGWHGGGGADAEPKREEG